MQGGDRVLTDTEWAAYSRLPSACSRDSIEEDIRSQADDADTGVPAFDRLTPEQKLVLLADVAHALRDPATPTPSHTAANEGAIAAVFSMMRVEMEMELDMPEMGRTDAESTEIRRMLREVGDEWQERTKEPLPDVTSTKSNEWDWLLEEFEGRIFWDSDFTMGDEFLDLPPDQARVKLQNFGIDPEYYLAVPVEPDKAGLTAARQTLARMLSLPTPDDHGFYPALEDLYHCLTIGPCSPEEIAAWEDNPWVQIIGMCEPGWDCDYKTWAASISRALPPTPFQLAQGTIGAVPESLPGRVKVEGRGDAWVVRDEGGSYWCGLVENCWTDHPNDEDMPALTFPTEAEAAAAYCQADRMYGDRKKRHEQAMAQLGLADE